MTQTVLEKAGAMTEKQSLLNSHQLVSSVLMDTMAYGLSYGVLPQALSQSTYRTKETR